MVLSLTLALLIAQSAGAAPVSGLHTTALQLDDALFGAYNRCELDKFQALLDPAVEFYHDKGGLTLGAQPLTESVRKNVCGRVRRTLVAGSMKVYPMDGFGLLQTGVHRFCEVDAQGACPTVGEAQFIHLWKRDGEKWRAVRIISFDHQPYREPKK